MSLAWKLEKLPCKLRLSTIFAKILQVILASRTFNALFVWQNLHIWLQLSFVVWLVTKLKSDCMFSELEYLCCATKVQKQIS